MTESATPQTDAEVASMPPPDQRYVPAVLADFARKLEKERDEYFRRWEEGQITSIEQWRRAEAAEAENIELRAKLAEAEQRNEEAVAVLQKIADDWPRQTNEGAQKWARDFLAAHREKP